MGLDFIGDIHGHAAELEQLLFKLGYRKKGSVYAHPSRKVLFVGDYIDRGPQIRETLELVKGMCESGHATALMGNHEYNALCFHFQERGGGHLRKHQIKNIIQHYDTLKQFQNKQSEYEKYLEWFKTLPLYVETEGFRAVHACWDQEQIDFLQATLQEQKLTDALIYESVNVGTALNLAVEQTLKGKELALPEGETYPDKDGTLRSSIRIKWWENPSQMTYRSISVEPNEKLPDLPLDAADFPSQGYYGVTEKKVFFGHYWLKGTPSFQKTNICCLDYSVANQGKLVAYRYSGEGELDAQNLWYV